MISSLLPFETRKKPSLLAVLNQNSSLKKFMSQIELKQNNRSRKNLSLPTTLNRPIIKEVGVGEVVEAEPTTMVEGPTMVVVSINTRSSLNNNKEVEVDFKTHKDLMEEEPEVEEVASKVVTEEDTTTITPTTIPTHLNLVLACVALHPHLLSKDFSIT